MAEHEDLFPDATREIAEHRSRLAPGPAEAFRAFSKAVFADGALPTKTKQLIAYVGDSGGVVAVERFGASAPGKVVLREYGFTVDNIYARALALQGDA